MQKDAVLRFETLCNANEIMTCPSIVSETKLTKNTEIEGVYECAAASICTVAVPAACHRITCFKESSQTYETCRLLSFIESQKNESGFWMKLPCSNCDEKRKLHSTTEAFVFDETGGNS